MKDRISAFLGICNDMFVITVTADGKNTYQFNPVQVCSSNEYEIRLSALEMLLRSFRNVEIDFYADDDVLSYEWESEYKVNKKFDLASEHYERWCAIAKIVEQNKIKLNIKNENQALSVMNRRVEKNNAN